MTEVIDYTRADLYFYLRSSHAG